MSTINDGGPAYPIADNAVGGMSWPPASAPGSVGMSLRDYFAAAVIQGYLAHPDRTIDIAGDRPGAGVAGWAYALADAMLAERAKVRP